MEKKEVVVSSTQLRKSLSIDYNGDNKPDFLLDDKKLLAGLTGYAKNFRASAEKAIETGDARYLPAGLEKQDAKGFMSYAPKNFDNEFERLAVKYFTKQLHGDGPNPEVSLGKYDSKTKIKLKEFVKHTEKIYKADVRFNLNGNKHDIEESEHSFNKMMDFMKDNGFIEIEKTEKLSDYGPREKSPVCRHYAPTLSLMLDAGGIPNHTFGNGAMFKGMYTFGSHAAVVIDRTGNIAEASSSDINNAYKVMLAADTDKGPVKSSLQALKEGGRVMTMTYRGDGKNEVTIYNTDNGLNSASDRVTGRFMIAGMNGAIKGGADFNQAKDYASRFMAASRQENKDNSFFEREGIRKFAESDSKMSIGGSIKRGTQTLMGDSGILKAELHKDLESISENLAQDRLMQLKAPDRHLNNSQEISIEISPR